MKKQKTIPFISATAFLLLLAAALLVTITGRYVAENADPNQIEGEQQSSATGLKELAIKALHNDENDLVFSFSISDFADSYNGYYQRDKKRIFFTPIEKWQISEADAEPYLSHKTLCYYFKESFTNWVLPSLAAYVPENEEYVREITVNFDDHSYREEMYALYEEMCFYTIKVLLHELSDEKITEIYQTLNRLAYDTVQANKNSQTPCAVYYKDGIGLYPDFAIGQSVRLCAIPVDEARINEWKRQGVALYEIEE